MRATSPRKPTQFWQKSALAGKLELSIPFRRKSQGDQIRMSLPSLAEWHDMKESLHQAMQVIGQVRLTGVGELPNSMQYGVYPMPYGATTGKLKYGGTFHLDFGAGKYIYEKDGEEVFEVSLLNQSPQALMKAVFHAFAEQGHLLEPNWEKATSTESLTYHLEHAEKYAEVQWWAHGVLARLKTWMFGPQSPIMLWSHGFDLSTLWFVEGMDEHNDPQINFGWSPGTPDVGQPYFYFYAYPEPKNLAENLPDNIHWHTEWATPGGLIKYAQFVGAEDSTQYVFDLLLAAYKSAVRLLKES